MMRAATHGNKYHARRTTLDGITFDSKREAKHWATLRILERAGKCKRRSNTRPR